MVQHMIIRVSDEVNSRNERLGRARRDFGYPSDNGFDELMAESTFVKHTHHDVHAAEFSLGKTWCLRVGFVTR